ncbi:MAG: ABC transporter ATP-binding protein [Oscillospiraceae bacterium]|nr:ABC transporter ATP-binding protein [Oscillospiraceae bacterium]
MIEVKKLCGGYGGVRVLRGVSLTLEDGQLTAIIGPNGCGKSTLLRLCCGQLSPQRGEVWADGRPLGGLTRKETAQSISLLPQSRAVPDITAGALALHGRFPWLGYPRVCRAEDRAAAEQAMRRVGIWEKRGSLLARLSGGERQKAYLAMLLAQDTQNVLLDEPTVYLDIAHQLELFALLKNLAREGKCVAAVEHDLGLALDNADRVILLGEGGVLFSGTPQELIDSGAIAHAFGVELTRGDGYRFSSC